MKEFLVSYELNGYVYHQNVITSSSGGAIYWVANLFPEAKNIYVIREIPVEYNY